MKLNFFCLILIQLFAYNLQALAGGDKQCRRVFVSEKVNSESVEKLANDYAELISEVHHFQPMDYKSETSKKKIFEILKFISNLSPDEQNRFYQILESKFKLIELTTVEKKVSLDSEVNRHFGNYQLSEVVKFDSYLQDSLKVSEDSTQFAFIRESQNKEPELHIGQLNDLIQTRSIRLENNDYSIIGFSADGRHLILFNQRQQQIFKLDPKNLSRKIVYKSKNIIRVFSIPHTNYLYVIQSFGKNLTVGILNVDTNKIDQIAAYDPQLGNYLDPEIYYNQIKKLLVIRTQMQSGVYSLFTKSFAANKEQSEFNYSELVYYNESESKTYQIVNYWDQLLIGNLSTGKQYLRNIPKLESNSKLHFASSKILLVENTKGVFIVDLVKKTINRLKENHQLTHLVFDHSTSDLYLSLTDAVSGKKTIIIIRNTNNFTNNVVEVPGADFQKYGFYHSQENLVYLDFDNYLHIPNLGALVDVQYLFDKKLADELNLISTDAKTHVFVRDFENSKLFIYRLELKK